MLTANDIFVWYIKRNVYIFVNSISDTLGRLEGLSMGTASGLGIIWPPYFAWLSTTSRKWPCIAMLREFLRIIWLCSSSIFIWSKEDAARHEMTREWISIVNHFGFVETYMPQGTDYIGYNLPSSTFRITCAVGSATRYSATLIVSPATYTSFQIKVSVWLCVWMVVFGAMRRTYFVDGDNLLEWAMPVLALARTENADRVAALTHSC